jgi:hypothetical protein
MGTPRARRRGDLNRSGAAIGQTRITGKHIIADGRTIDAEVVTSSATCG